MPSSFHSFAPKSQYRSFTVTNSTPLDELKCHLTELVHEETGAHVLHIHADDPENFFCLSFRTLPYSSNGIAHILEHTVLTGSQKYPVRDPFFSMNRRSLNTFMNALTGADFTCYPAATQVEQDFYNLLSVYLDAVFHPLLKKTSFAQEGHRLEFQTLDDPTSPLEFKGIVYNEMKGALASPSSRLNEAVSQTLFPNTPYGFNSGGDPKEIPNLSYEELIAFHKKYYHPSKCLFFFYGNLPLEKHLDFILEHALKGQRKEAELEPIAKQPRFLHPVRKQFFYPDTEESEGAKKTQIAFAWLTVSILDQLDVLALSVIDSVLMDTDASPLRYALLQSGLCTQAVAALETEIAEVPYQIVVRGTESAHADKLEEIIRTTITKIAHEGIEQKAIASALHQLELDRTEIGQDGGPFGLSLYGRSALMKHHGGNAIDGLSIHSLFSELRRTLEENPRYLSTLIQKHFLDNPHFVRCVMDPSARLTQEEEQEERSRLDAIFNTLSTTEKEQIIKRAEELKIAQENDDNDENEKYLPKIRIEDVPKKGVSHALSEHAVGNFKVFHHNTFTNGLVYLDLVFPLETLDENELWLARLFSIFAPQIGSGNRTYQETLTYIHEHTGGIGIGFSMNNQVENHTQVSPKLHLKGKALYRKKDQLFSLLQESATQLNFRDPNRIKELLFKHYTTLETSLNQNALRYASSIALSGDTITNHIANKMYGLDYVYRIKHLVNNFDNECETLIENLDNMAKRLLCTQNAHLVVTCCETEFNKYLETGFSGLCELPLHAFRPWKNEFTLQPVQSSAYTIASPVAFTAKGFSSLNYAHPDSPYLSCACQIFDNSTLLSRIREQGGAYGGGASYNPTNGNFYFYAYRDPHIASTCSAFEEAVHNVVNGEFEETDLEEAKLEMIQAIDVPCPPGSRGEIAYTQLYEGKTEQVRQARRDRILSATKEDIENAVRTHILPKLVTAPVISFAGQELIEKENNKLTTRLEVKKI